MPTPHQRTYMPHVVPSSAVFFANDSHTTPRIRELFRRGWKRWQRDVMPRGIRIIRKVVQELAAVRGIWREEETWLKKSFSYQKHSQFYGPVYFIKRIAWHLSFGNAQVFQHPGKRCTGWTRTPLPLWRDLQHRYQPYLHKASMVGNASNWNHVRLRMSY